MGEINKTYALSIHSMTNQIQNVALGESGPGLSGCFQPILSECFESRVPS